MCSTTSAVQQTQCKKAIVPESLTSLIPPGETFYIDQYKNGIFLDKQTVVKNRLIFGRAPDCDIVLEHPSISRYHAALLWSPKNDDDYQNGTNTESFWYLIDCGSTHGTVCNKVKVDTGKMIKINPNNNVIKFGASTRFFIFGSNLVEDESEISLSAEGIQSENEKTISKEDACVWGIQLTDCNDEEEESGDSIALKSIISAMKGGESIESNNKNAYSENAYKCIQQWFEREGYDFDYKVDSINGKFKCCIELPVDGQWIPVEGSLTNRKKDAISDASMMCCNILDQAQILFPWQRQNAKKDARKEFYDDDENDIFDETVNTNKKLKKDLDSEVDNYETLNAKWKTTNDELCQLKVKLATIGLEPGIRPEIASELTDSLDDYIANLNKKKFGLTLNEKIEKSNLRMKIKQLEGEQRKLEKLIQIAKPVEVKIFAPSKTITPKIEATVSDTVPQNIDLIQQPECNKPTGDITTHLTSNESEIKGKVQPTSTHRQASQQKTVESKLKVKQIRKMKQDSIIEAIEKEKKLEKQKLHKAVAENDSDYVGWLPPVNQSGDGKTHLNNKFGY